MGIRRLLGALLFAVLVYPTGAWAAGTLIPAPSRVDMVHDQQRDIVYITDGGNVLRYHVGSAAFLAPLTLGGQLGGIDLSPDGATLAVADRSGDASTLWVHLVRLADLSVSRVTMTKAFYEGGSWTVAFAADGTLFITSRHEGSGWVPMRRYFPATGALTTIASVRQDTMLAPSGDRRTIGFAEANISDGAWGVYYTQNSQLVQRTGYTNGTSAFNFEISLNADGSQFVIPTYFGTYFYNASYARVATVGTYAGQAPIGTASHPVEPLAYFPFAQTREVRVYDTRTFALLTTYDFEETFDWIGNWAFIEGRTRLSADGSLLMVTVTGGVRILRTYAPLAAQALTLRALTGAATGLTLGGSIGNGGALTYSLARAPAKGSVTVNGASATYTSNSGFTGTDSFRYRVSYGGASAEAEVAVTVDPLVVNRPPIAVDDSASTVRNTAVRIAVLSNDSDPDGDAIGIAGVLAPSVGTAVVDGAAIVYTPPRGFAGIATLRYFVQDGKGGSASANVNISVVKR